MAITIYDRDTIYNQTLAFFRNRFPNKDTSSESFLGKLAATFAQLALGIQKAAQDADNDSTPSTKTSSAALDSFAFIFGLSNGNGGYGRKAAIAATGGTGNCTGTNGTVIPDGSLLLASDGVTVCKLSGSVTISGGSTAGTFNAVTAGIAGNLPINSVLTWESPPAGLDATVTLTAAISGGVDTETDSDLLSRILLRLQNPPKGGTAADYREWAESISGINRAYVYPRRGGLGTVHVVITQAGSGTGRAPTSTSAVDTYINSVRPVTASYTGLLPYQPGSGLNIRVRVVPALSKYAFDWSSGTTSYTVAAVTTGSPATITFNTGPGTDFQTAVTNGNKPRLQILASGSGHYVVPVLARVTAYNSGTLVATLENPLPTGFDITKVNVGDVIYAGGPVCSTVATAILNYIDGLGPSWASGTYDSNDLWEDTAAVARVVQIALDQYDTDGVTKLLSNIVSVGGTPQALINGATTDIQAADNSVNAPELLFTKWIAVTD